MNSRSRFPSCHCEMSLFFRWSSRSSWVGPNLSRVGAGDGGRQENLSGRPKDAGQDDPGIDDIYQIGTVSTILQLLKLPDGTVKVLVEGVGRAEIESYSEVDDCFSASVVALPETGTSEREAEVISRSLLTQFEQYVKLNKKVPQEIVSSLNGIDDPSRLADTVAAPPGRQDS